MYNIDDMGENPKYPKIIVRTDTKLRIDGLTGEVEYTSNWDNVEGGKGVKCRTWRIKNGEANVDGADIIIEAGGYTPIQKVKSAEVVVDAPETGECWCVIMDTDGEIYVNYFDDTEKGQMVYSEGMIVCWIGKTEVKLTEFESPSFNDGMFENLDEEILENGDDKMPEYLRTVRVLRLEAIQNKIN